MYLHKNKEWIFGIILGKNRDLLFYKNWECNIPVFLLHYNTTFRFVGIKFKILTKSCNIFIMHLLKIETFLSPANRLAMSYGKALGALIQEVWMFCCFCVFIYIYTGTLSFDNLAMLPLIFLILIVSSTIWGGMLNTIFLFSRDASIIMDIFDTPMTLFSGSRIPVKYFPQWAKMISLIFPLTYCINIIRLVLNVQEEENGWIGNLTGLVICLVVMIVITYVLVQKVEKHNRENGQLQFY